MEKHKKSRIIKVKKLNLQKKIKRKISSYIFYIIKYPQSLIKAPFFLIFKPNYFFKKIIYIENVTSKTKIWNHFSILDLLFINKVKKAFNILLKQGPIGLFNKIKSKIISRKYYLSLNEQYQIWLKKNFLTKTILLNQIDRSKKIKHKPLISLITPIYNTNSIWIKKCVDSVIKQSYPNWELCLINDGSTSIDTLNLLSQLKNKDKRIKIKYLQENVGISLASQEGLYMAKGEFIGLLDSDDELTPDALYEIVSLINKNPNADFIYSDEDKIDEKNNLYDPFFKPDWSPNLLLSMMYTSHFTVYKLNLIKRVGGFQNKYKGSQDYDLALKISEKTNNIYHVPKILYHWRAIPTSAAFKGNIKGYPILNAKKALEDHLKRTKINASVEEGIGNGRWRIRYMLKKFPKITIILLTGGKLDLLNQCLISILTKTTYKNYKILIVDNSLKKETEDYLKAMKKVYKNKINFYKDNLKPFNYPALCNRAVNQVSSPYILLLNDDMKLITPNWLEAMMEQFQRNKVGIVGCKLLYPDNKIQHAGVIFGVYNNSGHAFKGINNNLNYYFDFPHVVRDVSAVTFACALMKTRLYREIGGLDEVKFKVAFNDTDFCLKVRKKGLEIIYTPHASLIHFESVTKPVHILPGEVGAFRKKWKNVIAHDPYYNPNLTRKKEDYSLNI